MGKWDAKSFSFEESLSVCDRFLRGELEAWVAISGGAKEASRVFHSATAGTRRALSGSFKL